MNKPLICHFLIGTPASGKSTFAAQLSTQDNYITISTDAIRTQLYGNETIQGNWHDIETILLTQISESITAGTPVIYDATNAKRPYRMALLQKLPQQNCYWIAWHLKTSLPQSLKWNKQRTRQVPENIIKKMFQSLKNFPPLVAEGFAAVHTIQNDTFNPKTIQQKIDSLTRSNINRQNRTSCLEFHSYSRLLDFDRLIHLISLLIQYPGLGNLQETTPDVLTDIFKELPQFPDALAEIVAVMAKLKGEIYADREAIATDLAWLESNGIVAEGQTVDAAKLDEEISPLTPLRKGGKEEEKETSSFPLWERGKEEQVTSSSSLPLSKGDGRGIKIIPHPYSDVAPFKRLMTAIRLILNQPFLREKDSDKKSLDVFVEILSRQPGMGGDCRDQFRKDVENILKPFQILRDFPMRHGYFAGTGILSQSELKSLQNILGAQKKSMENLLDLSIYERLCERMVYSKIETEKPYPVIAIAHQSMIDLELLSKNVLSRNLEVVEDIIINGKLVELGRFKGKGKFTGDAEGKFAAWLLQIVFFNDAWYLGFECKGGSDDGLLRFERLDRLYISQDLGKFRSQQKQLLHLQKLQKLLDASFGIFLGYSAADQNKFLSKKNSDKKEVIVTVELWFNEDKFKFACEKTKRFPSRNLKMSPPPQGRGFIKDEEYQKVFCLPPTKDKYFPHRFEVKLPRWSLKDVFFLSWIIGFSGNVKVVKPQELIDIVHKIGLDIVEVYEGKSEEKE
ncbi:MAG: WYL domain-containing protein [Okeania sp. SIO3I5]|uniref:AAA family ATPase n=1 Tax=Okeania sp. SIO3I5 TaxID=2607805 RepID=UPI0013B75100|nr:AAA family ATPase [Okeania sp. SIO3I5]NEQ39941.1 WYL domain-containing protein [Okeania sp. SIO3I5]